MRRFFIALFTSKEQKPHIGQIFVGIIFALHHFGITRMHP